MGVGEEGFKAENENFWGLGRWCKAVWLLNWGRGGPKFAGMRRKNFCFLFFPVTLSYITNRECPSGQVCRGKGLQTKMAEP